MAAGSGRRARARFGAALVLGALLMLFAQQLASADANPQLDAANDRLEKLAELFDAFDGIAELSEALPLGDMNPADALNLTDVFVDDDPAFDDDDPGVADPVAAGKSLKEMLQAASNADLETAASFETFLTNLSEDYGDFEIIMTGPESGHPTVVDRPDPSTLIDIAFALELRADVDVPLALPTDLVDLLGTPGTGEFPLQVSLKTNTFHFQIDSSLLESPATTADALYLLRAPEEGVVGAANAGQAPKVTVSIATDPADPGGVQLGEYTQDVGFTQVTVGGTVGFDAALEIELLDPDDPDGDGPGLGDGRIGADELASTALEDIGDVTVLDPSGDDVFATITLDSDLVGAADSTDATISYNQASFAGPLATPGFSPSLASMDLADFRNFTAEDALAALDRLIGMLDGIQSTGRMDLDLPFIDGVPTASNPSPSGGLGDALRLALPLDDAVSDPANGLVVDTNPAADVVSLHPTFTNIQGLEDKLETYLGLDDADLDIAYDATNDRLTVDVPIAHEGSAAMDLAFGGLDILSTVDVTTGGDVTAAGSFDIPLTFGLSIADLPLEDGAGPLSCTDGLDNGSDGVTDAVDGDCASLPTMQQRVAIEVGQTAGTPEISAQGAVSSPNISADAVIGMVEAGISAGKFRIGSVSGEEDGDGAGTCFDGVDNGDADGVDSADPDCQAGFAIDITDTGDGWLTVEELFDLLGATDVPAGATIATTTTGIALDGSLPVSATIGSTSLGGGTISLSGDYTGALADFGELLRKLKVDAAALHATDLFKLSPCGNDKDDDGDGKVNDGCTQEGDVAETDAQCADATDNDSPSDDDSAVNDGCPAVDDAEGLSAALFDRIVEGLHALGDGLLASGLIPNNALDAKIPLVNTSFNDVLAAADRIKALADEFQTPGETACDTNADDDHDGAPNDGCGPDGPPETGAQCTNSTNDDGDGKVNDGCPPVAPTLQDLEQSIEGTITDLLDSVGTIPADDPIDVTLEYDTAADDLIFRLDSGVDVTKTVPLAFQLSGLPDFASLSGAGNLQAALGFDLQLDFGLQLSDFKPFVLGSTGLTVDGSIASDAAGLQFTAGLGPLQLQVGETTPTPEAVCTPDGDPVVDDDNDGVADDGCGSIPAAADRARVALGANLDLQVAGGEDDKRFLPGMGGTTVSFAGSDGFTGTDQDLCAGIPNDGDTNNACAILPLYFDADGAGGDPAVPVKGDGSAVDAHHLNVYVDSLSFPPTAPAFQYDTSKLLSFIEGQVLDLLLLESGLQGLIDTIRSFIEDQLLSFDLPIIGDKLAEAVHMLDDLEAKFKASIVGALDGENPLNADSLTPDAGQVEDALNAFVTEVIGEPTLGNIVTDPLTASVRCKATGGGTRECDTGYGEHEANPALDDSAATPQCDGDALDGGDDDGDGWPNDGCETKGVPETDCDNDDGADPATEDDEDGDGTVNDGCTPDNPATDLNGPQPETDCQDTTDNDLDGFVNDGCVAKAESGANVTDVRFDVTLGQSITEAADGVNFDLGIPGLDMDLLSVENAAPSVTLDWSLHLGFGVSKDDGFYIATDYDDPDNGVGEDPELSVGGTLALSSGAQSAGLKMSLGFLAVRVIDGDPDATCDSIGSSGAPCRPVGDDDSPASSFNPRFTIDLKDPNDDGKLTFTEMSTIDSFDDLAAFALTADANLRLHIETTIGPEFSATLPKLIADLHLGWHFALELGDGTSPDALEPGTTTTDGCVNADNCLTVELNNVALDAGTFISKFLQPVLSNVQQFTEPFDPIIEKLNEPIPVLSDLSGSPVTLLDLAKELGPADNNYELIIAIVELVDFINNLQFSPTGNLTIPIGSFDLAANTLQGGEIAASAARSAFLDPAGQLDSLTSLMGALKGKTGDISSGDGKVQDLDGLQSIGLSFPFLQEPAKLLGLLFKQDVDLVVWQPPELKFGFSYSQQFGPIWAVPPVFLEVGGSVSVTGRFGIGYDTQGLREMIFEGASADALLHGLFLVDVHPYPGGPDSNELELRGEIFANAQVSVLIFSAGAEGSVFVTIGIDLQDPNGDGRLKWDEAAAILRNTGSFLCLFNLNGQFGVRISVFAEVDLFFWSQRWTKTLAEIILYEFKVECAQRTEPTLASPADASGSDKTLLLHMGPNAGLRGSNTIGEGETEETFVVTKVDDGVEVTAFGFTQHYPGSWERIDADGGTDKDVITMADGMVGAEEICDEAGAAVDNDGDGDINDGCPRQGPDNKAPESKADGECAPGNTADEDGDGFVNDGCPTNGRLIDFTIPTQIDGGPGADQITGSDGADTINGDAGADSAEDGSTDGDDKITGGEGVNTIHGNGGADQIGSGASVDFLYGDGGNDTIDGGLGGDTIDAGAGNDSVDGGRSIPATTNPAAPAKIDGADNITLGTGDDSADGGDGGDTISAGAGKDTVLGGNGNDTITDGGSNEGSCSATIDGEDDVFIGGPGRDTLQAAAGDDILVGGNNIAGFADEGDAELSGGHGCDILLGDNALFPDASNPRSFVLIEPTVGGGETAMNGGDGNDVMHGQIGVETMSGNAGDDTMFGEADGDIMYGGSGVDSMYGGDGDDDVIGGGDGDHVYGDAGEDFLLGDDGTVDRTPSGRDGDDPSLNGGTGVDDVHGGSGRDHIYGQGSGDQLFGDSGDDDVFGDGDEADNADSLIDGNDVVRGGLGNDYLFGNAGADDIYGEGGNDRMVGGSPNATNPDGPAVGDPAVEDQLFGDFGADTMSGDNATISSSFVVTLLSEATIGGADQLFGQHDVDHLFGENGNDYIEGNGADDHAEGGDDDDTIFGNDGNDDLIGGTTEAADGHTTGHQPDGGDTITAGTGGDVVLGDNGIITKTIETNPDGTPLRLATLYDLDDTSGTYSGQDTLQGNEVGDALYGGAEHDVVHGNGGDDHIEGNNGDDDLYGDTNQDDLIGGTSAEVDEVVDGATGDGSHPDTGKDQLYGGDGAGGVTSDDHDVACGDNCSIRRTEDGADWTSDDLDVDRGVTDVVRRQIELYDIGTLTAAAPAGTSDGDELFGEDDWDILYGQGGNDLLRGGPVDDYLEGNAGVDTLYGEAGQDDLVGGTGRTVSDDPSSVEDGRLDDGDFLYGGDGAAGDGAVTSDDFDVEMGDNATILRGDPPGTPGAAWELNTFNDSVQRAVYLYDVAIVGDPVDANTNGVDVMRGQADDDLMYGQGDNDDMEGDSGDDYMEGNDGADKIAGEDGNDDMTGGTGLINDDIPPPTDPDGTPGRYDEGETDLSGGNGFDTIAGDNAIIRRVLDENGDWVPNTYNAGIQHERIVLVDINSSSKHLVSGPDVMNGNADDDVMYGQDNRALDNETLGDVMHGNDGDDYMEGNAGADQMYGDAGQDDMAGGTGRVNADPPAGTPGRFDGDDQMDGGAGHDEMAGDNSIIERLLTTLPEGDWQTQSYSHAEDDPTAEHGDRTLTPEPVARVRRTVVAVDLSPGTTSGSDLMRGSAGDDDIYGQFDDTGESGADGGGYAALTSSTWCGMTVPVPNEHPTDPDPRTPVNYDRVPDDWSHALVDGEAIIGGDTLCGNEGEDAILGDQGRILNIVEGSSDVSPYDADGNRQSHIRPNEPFIDEDIFVVGTLTREVTLQQIPTGGNDLILGGADGDSLHGGAGVDLINGERGDDRSFGGNGNDAIWGGRGHDHSYGGYGADHLDVRPRTTAVKTPADPYSWFFAAPDDLTTINDNGTPANPSDDKEDYDGYNGIDFIYGGYDQDAMQANVGDAGPVLGDRLMDWSGSYNAYYLCPAVFGERVITRDMSPSIIKFWEDMARGDGAQPTTIGEGKSITTDSGFNELAMVYKPDVKKNQKPVHPDTPGHFTCDGPLPIL